MEFLNELLNDYSSQIIVLFSIIFIIIIVFGVADLVENVYKIIKRNFK